MAEIARLRLKRVTVPAERKPERTTAPAVENDRRELHKSLRVAAGLVVNGTDRLAVLAAPAVTAERVTHGAGSCRPHGFSVKVKPKADDPRGWSFRQLTVRAVWRPGNRLSPAALARLAAAASLTAADPRSAVRLNKDLLNAASAIAVAAGQDVASLEAAAWAEAYKGGACAPLAAFRQLKGGFLYGVLKMPLAVEACPEILLHPSAVKARKLMAADTPELLAETIGAAALSAAFASLASLAFD